MQANRLRAVLMIFVAFGLASGVVYTLIATGDGVIDGGGPQLERPYLEIREVHRTILTERVRAPGAGSAVEPPASVNEVVYSSGELKLKAWLAFPTLSTAAPLPAIVYLHGGFALGKDDFVQCKPFLSAGYAVLLPSFRGENDNPGQFEMLYGEVDDARAAVAWLAQHERIDKTRIYAFGHSIGGGISALLSLWDNVPLRATGSCGGLFPYAAFAGWSDIVPFDRRSPLERQLRLLLGNTSAMKLPHDAYIGEDDELTAVIRPAEQELAITHAPLRITVVAGNHMTSLDRSTRRFLKDIETRK